MNKVYLLLLTVEAGRSVKPAVSKHPSSYPRGVSMKEGALYLRICISASYHASATRGNTGRLLLVNEQHEQDDEPPAWVGTFIRHASVIKLKPVQISTTVLLAGLYGAVAYFGAVAAIAAGYAHTMP